ncbi:MAG TPA: CheR family methyltransferase [Anaeromyxobacter sp.]
MGSVPSELDIEIRLLLEAVYLRYQHDFRHYALASLRRRIPRAVEHFGLDSVSALQGRVLRDAAAFRELLPFLTVQVSEMFRDPPFFLALRRDVLPRLETYPTVRVWVAGCSAGEEVYALAILLREEGLLERSIVYASDVSPDALERAERGIYELDRVEQFGASYLAAGGRGALSDYYTAAYGAARFDPALRANVVFTDHSLATDHVFAEVQLVTCRNVLIYFDAALQNRAVGLFRDALCHRGVLGLGLGETLRFTEHADAFEPLNASLRLYRKR